ncbi:MAG: NfeD family protein [Imperialibacter sp.]|uniref:NfeD family protein n=1 Tax=Imperialibacter sp. TaxID=2038411 RepID=UPI0032F07296
MNLLKLMNKKSIFILLMALPFLGLAQQKQTKVLRVLLAAEIDPRTNRLMELALNQATEDSVDYVVIEMDTYGGALTDADEIRTRVLDFEKPVYVYINKDAASAGALISIACDSIYMAKAASIGAATVVTSDGAAAPDKYQSYMRSIMRSTAEANGRDPRIAEAMVDETLEFDSITQAGKVLTFSTSEAIKNGYCEAQVSSIDEIMERSGVTDYELIDFKLDATDKIIALFLNPFVSGILILIIIGGIYFELQTPGVGFPIIAAVIAATLYFVPYYLNGLAENWEIIMFFIGVLLIAAEIFVIPGFGVAGVAGIIFTLGSLILVMVNNDNLDFSFVELDSLLIASVTAIIGIMGSIVLMFFGGARLSQSKVFNRVALGTSMERSAGYTSSFMKEPMVGKTGEAHTILRPSGKVLIDGDVFDAFTRGNYIDKGAKVVVISDEGTSLKVKEVE